MRSSISVPMRGTCLRDWFYPQVHNEKWVGPYNGGAELAGCGGREGTFAKRPGLERNSLEVLPLISQNLARPRPEEAVNACIEPTASAVAHAHLCKCLT